MRHLLLALLYVRLEESHGLVRCDLSPGRQLLLFERRPEDLLPGWIPSGVRFERVGGID